jgi:hypothetical protein
MVRVTSVRCQEGFVLELGFSDGASRRIDLSPCLWGPAFEPHRTDPAFFRSVRVDPRSGTIAWPDDTDLDPDVLRWNFLSVDAAPQEPPSGISWFFGIHVRMIFDAWAPPHLRASYQDEEVLLRLDTLEVLAGSLPRRALGFVAEWAALHRVELEDAWARAGAGQPLAPIAPLE